ncbi:LrgB family protein [Ornithinibacillus contaminans]|uniref:LrgB family protein n=1 Tax=Ornithinibacillus contaminans TaxID=694055 RepID=UPI00064DDEBB|nr:LrgB family protein [Ornithinibacillus contaminans]
MVDILLALLIVLVTIGSYMVAVKFHQLYNYPFTAPMIIASIILITILIVFHIPYETYMIGGKWINELLGPAVVALAYPLYRNRQLLKQLASPILIGAAFGSFVGVLSGIYLSKLAGVSDFVTYSLLPKNVTTPVAMDIAEAVGGETSLTAIFVVIAGVGGVSVSTIVFKLFHVNNSLAKGIGLGGASHAIGTASAMEENQLAGSIGSVAMVISALIVSVITPLLITLLM